MDSNYISKFIKNQNKCHFMQSQEWTKVKNNWESKYVTVEDEEGNLKGIMSILIIKMINSNKILAYCPRGPVWDIRDHETFINLIVKAKKIANEFNCYVLRIDPDISIKNLEFQNLLKDQGFIVKNDKVGFEYTQPRFVMRIDIANKKNEEVFMSFSKKARKNIRSAEKKGVTIRLGNKNDLKEFLKVLRDTEIRKNIKLRNIEYFERMFEAFSTKNIRLYLAYYKKYLISGVITINYGNKCWCLYSGTANTHREIKASYLLRWNIIKWAIKSDCEIFDLMGVSGDIKGENKLYDFKKVFGSKLTEFIGECDLIIDNNS
jgi:lipid II:glycine glycyltransferase (peptidoglycan interpeptide bridge formation enzyme)